MDEKSPFRPCGRNLAGFFKSTGMGVSGQLDAEQLNFRRESRGMKKMEKSSAAKNIRVHSVGHSGVPKWKSWLNSLTFRVRTVRASSFLVDRRVVEDAFRRPGVSVYAVRFSA
jgi:hypothetical protein